MGWGGRGQQRARSCDRCSQLHLGRPLTPSAKSPGAGRASCRSPASKPEPAQSREALSSLRLEDFLRSSSLALSSSEYFLSLLEDFFFFFSLRSSSLSSSYLDDFFFDRRSSSLSSSYLLDFFFDL